MENGKWKLPLLPAYGKNLCFIHMWKEFACGKKQPKVKKTKTFFKELFSISILHPRRRRSFLHHFPRMRPPSFKESVSHPHSPFSENEKKVV